MAHTAPQRPTLVCLIGPPAVGKTTVGQELCRLTGFHLAPGHVLAEILTPYFPFGTPSYARLSHSWRRSFFEEACTAGLHVVTTVAWRFDRPEDAETIGSWLAPYRAGGRVLCVELVAPLAVRVERNRSEPRRRNKRQDWVTEQYLRDTAARHRYDSGGAFPLDLPHLRLETSRLAALATAQQIVTHFDLPHASGFDGCS